jgi:tryptophan synthase alpha chain
MNGIRAIENAFSLSKAEKRAALMPYFTLGYPTREASLDIIQSVAASGADLIELGLPFSDPLADGPTIQRSTQIALENGITMSDCIEMTRELRDRGVQQPLLLMGYYNPILAYGIERYIIDAQRAGADGFIIPDLPPDEAETLEDAAHEANLAVIFLIAPTSTDHRIELVLRHSTGFIYLVSVAGVTGARTKLPVELHDFVSRVRIKTSKPLAVGFGIGSGDQALQVGQIADGVIIGSALINLVDQASKKEEAAGTFIAGIRAALEASKVY